MKNLMKKIVVSIVGLSMIVMMAPVAQAVTAEELQAQIADLTAKLADLQAQLTALTGAPAAAACTFTRNLYPGMSGADVKCLQQYLNGAGFAVAASGVGSAGNETQYFGPLTQAAVKKWQDANGVVYGAYGGYFGPISQAKFTALAAAAPPAEEEEEEEVAEGITTPGAEGSIIATIASTPASGVVVYTTQTGIGVAAANVKATGSDVLVNRLDINFSVRPWLYLTGLTVTDGTVTKSIAVTEAGTTEITVGSSYDVRITGLNFLIPKDTTKTLTVKVDAVSSLPSGEATAINLIFKTNALRGVDGAGIQLYAPSDVLTRTFTVDPGATATLELTANVDNPKARPIIVSDTAKTSGIVLLKANVKAKNRDAILRTVTIGNTAASGTIDVIYLYDGDTLLSSTSSVASAASSTLENVNLTIPKDTTKTLTVKADFNMTTGYYEEGETTAIFLENTAAGTAGSGLAAEDAVTFAAATVSGSTVTPGTGYAYLKAPSLALASASINSVSVATGTITYNGKADARIKINVTASGGDIYVASSTANDVTATTTLGASTTVVESITSNADASSGENWVVRSGETKWFEIYAQLTRVDDGNSSTVGDLATYVYLTNIKWASTDAGVAASYNNQTWGLTDFKTTSIILEYFR